MIGIMASALKGISGSMNQKLSQLYKQQQAASNLPSLTPLYPQGIPAQLSPPPPLMPPLMPTELLLLMLLMSISGPEVTRRLLKKFDVDDSGIGTLLDKIEAGIKGESSMERLIEDCAKELK